MIKPCLLTDEISADPETAIEIGASWGMHDFELRGFYTDRFPRFTAYQKQRLKDVLEAYQAQIVAVSPGLFKVPFPAGSSPKAALAWLDFGEYMGWSEARKLVKNHLEELLPASLDYANELGVKKVVIFGFDRGGLAAGKPPDEAVEVLRRAAERAGAAGIDLVLENEAGFWTDTGARTAQMVKMVNNPALGINWDPANAFFACDQAYPQGYAAVRGLVRHLHFKDARLDSGGQPEYAVFGEVDWSGQIQALAADGYDGYISVETHTRPKIANTKALLERLQILIKDIDNGIPG